jgi:hypothetical protein
MSDMTNEQRAQQFWSVLVFAAKEQKILSYTMIERMTGMDRRGAGKPLGHIAAYCLRKKLPLLNALAVNQDTGKPSPDFLQGIDVAVEQVRVFTFDWSAHGAPKIEELKDDYTWAHSTGQFQAAPV